MYATVISQLNISDEGGTTEISYVIINYPTTRQNVFHILPPSLCKIRQTFKTLGTIFKISENQLSFNSSHYVLFGGKKLNKKSET